jgi:hypothetical protein
VNDDSTVAYPTLAVIGTNVAGNQALRPHSRHQEVFHARDARAAGSVAERRSRSGIDWSIEEERGPLVVMPTLAAQHDGAIARGESEMDSSAAFRHLPVRGSLKAWTA